MSARQPSAVTPKRTPGRAMTPDTDLATRQRVIEAAVASILERGFYRASTNEIARRAGVTWGVIQHYFGTREALMVAVLHDGAHRFIELVEGAHVSGDSVESRTHQLIEILTDHYAQPAFLAYVQILLNLDGDPRTSAAVHQTMRDLAAHSHVHVRRLLDETLGSAQAAPDLATTLFVLLRGFGISQQLAETMAYDAPAPVQDRVASQRRLLARIITPYIEHAAGGHAG